MGKYSFDFDYLAKKLNETIGVVDEKKISFKDIFLLNDLESILESAYDFEITIPESQKSFIIHEGIRKFALKTKKDGKNLKGQIKLSELEFLKKPFEKYSILSSLSFPYFDELSNIRLANGIVTFFTYSYPKKFNFSKIYNELEAYQKSIPPHNYIPVKVDITARNHFEAIEKGLDLLDFIRGIWNYSINKKLSSRIHIGQKEPINIIRRGPTTTLHFPNGKLATELFWYEPDYKEKSAIWDVKNKWNIVKRDFTSIKKALNKLPYKDRFSKIFIRYTRALDTIDYETSYLKLWSLLELLTDTINSNYDKTISRALFFYKDDILSKEIIEHLRIFRNKIVHFGESKEELDFLLFQLKRIVERIMWFHLKFSGKFESIEEFGKFLDLSKNKDTLEQEISFRKKHLNFYISE